MTTVELVYTTTCVYCAPAKKLFKDLQKEIPFDYKEIDATSPEGQKLVSKFQIMAVPTIIIDDKVAFVGLPNKNAVVKALKG